MYQENLFAAPARCTGFVVTWSIDHLQCHPSGILSVRPTFAKHPGNGVATWAKRLDENDVELLPQLLAEVPAAAGKLSAEARLPRHMENAYRTSKAREDNRQSA